MLIDDETHNTEFPTGNLDSFLNEINQPKQNMDIDQNTILDGTTIPDDTIPPQTDFGEIPGDDSIHLDSFTTEAASEILVGIIDTALPAGLAAFAKGKTEDFQAEKEQKRTLQKSFKKYLETKGVDLPPGWLLFFLVLTIYGVKVPTAISMRKEFHEENEREKTIAEQKRTIEQLKQQIAEQQKETEEQTETKE